jgi:hypothetical protein
MAVGDLDGDGAEDLLISQNYFSVRPEDGRMDAGRGLLLLGNGKGGFRAVAGQTSGIKVYGEQRGCALADYDEDGRLDLVITQNNDQTRLFHNTGGKPGLRVRLAGSSDNPDGIGASLQLHWAGKTGPAREVQAGGGFWSQNSSVQVLGCPEPATEITVRWPGGKTVRCPIAPSAREVQISPSGVLKVLK